MNGVPPTRPSVGGRSPDRPLLTRDAIVTAAREMLVEEGLDGLSLRRLASALGVTAPALYLHVRDKRDLLQAVADTELESLIDRFHHAGRDGQPVECIRRRSHAYVDYAVENPELFRALFLRRPELTSEPWEGQQPLAAKTFEVAVEPVHRAIRSGELGPIDPDLAATTMWAVMHGVATLLVSGPRLPDHIGEHLASTAIDAALAGLAA